MSPLLTPFRIEAGFWLLLCGCLAIGIGHEIEWGGRMTWPLPDFTGAPASFTPPALTEPFRLLPPDNYPETTLRPMLVATRRPAPILSSPNSGMKKGQFVLTGTTLLPEGKFAFLLEKAGNKVHVISEGKAINGIVVKRVRDNRIVLTQYDDEEVLELQPAKPNAPPVPAVTAEESETPDVPAFQRPSRKSQAGQAPSAVPLRPQ